MIRIDNVEKRNLEETVQFLVDKYNANQGVAEWGIRVLGVVESAEDLPNPLTYTGNYGDTYAVGTETPYDFYIWTRDALDATPGFWFDFGNIAIVGPTGPTGATGDPGPQGIRGSQWFSGTGRPTTTSGYNVGDYYINVSNDSNRGNIWHLHDVNGVKTWLLEGNILGPQGPQGEIGPKGNKGDMGSQGIQGPAGPIGPLCEIVGIATASYVASLGEPEDKKNAYLVLQNGVYTIWMWTGGSWSNIGDVAASSLVYTDGVLQTSWDTNTKVNRIAGTGARRVYAISGGGVDTSYELKDAIATNPNLQIVCRASDGNVNVPLNPISNYHATSKAYVDSRGKGFLTTAEIEAEGWHIYFQLPTGTNRSGSARNLISNISYTQPCTGGNATNVAAGVFINSENELIIIDAKGQEHNLGNDPGYNLDIAHSIPM